ncbi:hypothetical protein VNO77_34830 [Canavalia gladiata]|uniref:Uncharacterized protein n=1 Tax=Canavalia gladiata TaxID=3824 RepID=A0AAN9KE30_CANGL
MNKFSMDVIIFISTIQQGYIGFGALAPTLGNLILIIGVSGFVTGASAVGTVAGSIHVATSFGGLGFEYPFTDFGLVPNELLQGGGKNPRIGDYEVAQEHYILASMAMVENGQEVDVASVNSEGLASVQCCA